ncbi:MAG: hypothetical protein AMXMBFR36_31140 [Acidobacteriota bacterium]
MIALPSTGPSPRRGARRFARGPAFLAAVALVAACDGSGSAPTSPARSTFDLTSAEILVDGQVVNGAVLPAHHDGAPTRFEARLESGGRPVEGGVVYCQYQRPGSHGMHHQGVFALHDDGTHGDRTPGDGLYCLDDDRGQYGCHGDGAGPGTYHYEFWGRHPSWGETEHHRVTVTVR